LAKVKFSISEKKTLILLISFPASTISAQLLMLLISFHHGDVPNTAVGNDQLPTAITDYNQIIVILTCQASNFKKL
jgi:hypothetical protein